MTDNKEQKNGIRCAAEWMRRHWAVVLAALFVLSAGFIYLLAGEEHAQIAVADNLDLFQAQYQMLKNTGTFFSSEAEAPFLHGISRNALPSEFTLEAVLYLLLPSYGAYVAMYLVKVLLGTISFILLAGEMEIYGCLEPAGAGQGTQFSRRSFSAKAAKNKGQRWNLTEAEGYAVFNLAVLSGLAYGCLNLFPSFGIAFASIPLLVWFILRLWRAQTHLAAAGWLVLIFCYPWVSYFSYFGIFLLGYLVIAWIWLLLLSCHRRANRKRSMRLLEAVVVLAAGYVVWEHRLFTQMLLGTETTIRETMVQTSLSAGEIVQWIGNLLLNGVELHCESAHRFIVLPVCVIFWIVINAGSMRKGQWRRCTARLFNLGVLTLLFNSVVYGLYYCESFRGFVEAVLPPLKGFQFNRTAFFNPFVWYGMFYLALRRTLLWGMQRTQNAEALSNVARTETAEAAVNLLENRSVIADKSGAKGRRIPQIGIYGAALAAILVILTCSNRYNDLLHTTRALVKQSLGKEPDNTLSYGEFYSAALFEKACEEIGYQGEWSAAYGFHPAVLEYNGIATIDGYLGFYSEEYKESFRKVIAPALEQNESSRIYYDEWGARCYMYSADQATVVEPVRNYVHAEDALLIDAEALRELDCRYIFSRIKITNAEELGLRLCCTCTEESSPYVLFVYED